MSGVASRFPPATHRQVPVHSGNRGFAPLPLPDKWREKASMVTAAPPAPGGDRLSAQLVCMSAFRASSDGRLANCMRRDFLPGFVRIHILYHAAWVEAASGSAGSPTRIAFALVCYPRLFSALQSLRQSDCKQSAPEERQRQGLKAVHCSRSHGTTQGGSNVGPPWVAPDCRQLDGDDGAGHETGL